MIPYGRQTIDDDDIDAVVEALRSGWLTTGPRVAGLERAVADYAGVGFGVAVSSGTAALHAAMFALNIVPGDEVIVPSITFAATANCVVYQGGTPIFADVTEDTLLIDPSSVERMITPRTRAVIGVDYAGHPCDWDALRTIAARRGLALVADGCHALGAEYRDLRVGSLADMTVFSFHPVKHITTGEGGMIVTDDSRLAECMARFRNHGITTDFREREAKSSWLYEITDLGFNYRLTDIQCALGMAQMKKLPVFVSRRRRIAGIYDLAFKDRDGIRPLAVMPHVLHSYHLYVVRVPERDRVFSRLRQAGIGVNVHYIPVHLHPYYRRVFNTGPGLCPVAESVYETILSLPIYPALTEDQQLKIINGLTERE